MFAGASTPTVQAGPSRSDAGGLPQPREFSEARRPRIHVRRLRHRDSDDDSVHNDIVRLLKDVEERLAAELARAEEAELRAREADARAAALKVAHRTLQDKTKAAQESVLAYQTELRNALTQLEAGQAEIQRLEVERTEAEEAAARARTTARKATEMLTAENAREEGRREGMAIGRREGLRIARAQGWSSADEADERPLESVFRTELASPIEAELTSPTRARRPRRQPSAGADSTQRRPRQRPSTAPMSEPPPAPGVPDFAPMATTIPRETMTTPLPRMPEIATVHPTPTHRARQTSVRSPQHSRARSSSIAGRNISAPIPIPGRPISPSPGPSNEPHVHPPVQQLPDSYIPTIDEDSEVPFPLPPPHELSGFPATPSMSARAPLNAATAPVTGVGPTGAGPAVATIAARAVTRGIKSMFKSAKRASTTAMSDLSLLREPAQAAPSNNHVADTAPRRPALSVILEGSGSIVQSRGPSHSNMPPPRPIFPPAEQATSPIAPQYTGSREPSISPTVESGLPGWNAEQTRRRMAMASELRNSDPDVDMDLLIRDRRRQPQSPHRPPEVSAQSARVRDTDGVGQSVRSGTTGNTSFYHRYNRTRPQMPKPLAPTVAHLQEQAEMYGGSSASVADSRVPSEGRYPYSNRTPARSVSSVGGRSSRRKPPPGMPTPTISVQPPTRNNSFQPPSASIVFSPGQAPTPQPHPVSPNGPPTVSIISPVPTRPRSTSGPSITVTRPRSRTESVLRPDASPRPLRRSGSVSSIGSASSARSRRSAYKAFDKTAYVDPAFMATNDPDHNPFAPGTRGAAIYSRSRPPSPNASSYAHDW